MHFDGDKETVKAKRRELAVQMRNHGEDDSLANEIPKEDLSKLEKRLTEQESQKKWTGHLNWKTILPKPIYTYPRLQTKDLLRDLAVIKQHEKDNEIDSLERSIKQLKSNLNEIKQSLSNIGNRDGTEDQLATLTGDKNDVEKELAEKEGKLAKLKGM